MIFQVALEALQKEIPPTAPVVAALDDTLLPKSGRKTPGVAYRRDPLGPPFRVNFIGAQRFIQLSAALFTQTKAAPARMVPLDFRHAPTPKKPRPKAPAAEWDLYRQQKKEMNLSLVGAQCIRDLRHNMDQNPNTKNRNLVVNVDGSYTNKTVLKNLPHQTTLIGRLRKDAKLYYPPQDSPPRGRKRLYGPQAPTPEQLRQDPHTPYQTITAWAAGKIHHFKVKSLGPLKWPKAGGNMVFRLVVIAPLAYRLTKKAPLLYRQPAYLACSDPNLPLDDFIQSYLWRWEIELNFRDEKTILGAGQAQVRTQASVMTVPALIVAAYALLLIAARRAFGPAELMTDSFPSPFWRHSKLKRPSTQKLINHLRAEMWGPSLGLDNFSHFVKHIPKSPNLKIWKPDLKSAILYAIN